MENSYHVPVIQRIPTGAPLGGQDFIAMVETKLGEKVRPGKRGRKPLGGRTD